MGYFLGELFFYVVLHTQSGLKVMSSWDENRKSFRHALIGRCLHEEAGRWLARCRASYMMCLVNISGFL